MTTADESVGAVRPVEEAAELPAWVENGASYRFHPIALVRDLWTYRELARAFAVSTLRVRYKQAAFGIANPRAAPVAAKLQAGEAVIQRQLAERLPSGQLRGIFQRKLPAGGNHLDQLPLCCDRKLDEAAIRRQAAKRDAEIRMRPQSARQRHVTRVLHPVMHR